MYLKTPDKAEVSTTRFLPPQKSTPRRCPLFAQSDAEHLDQFLND